MTKKRTRAKTKTVPQLGADCDVGPAQRYQHGDVIVLEETMQAGQRRVRNRTQSVLDRYLLRGQIGDRQFDAGGRLYRQWRAAGDQVSVTGRYDQRLGRSPNKSEFQFDMRGRVDRALRDVGKQLSAVLVHVCLCDLPARDWAVRIGGAPQAGIVVLRLALDALADHYEKGRRGRPSIVERKIAAGE